MAFKGLENIEKKTIDKEQFQNLTKSIGKNTFLPSLKISKLVDLCMCTHVCMCACEIHS